MAGAAAVAATAAALGVDRGGKASAASGGPLILGAANDAGGDGTAIQSSYPLETLLAKNTSATGVAVKGLGNGVPGIDGASLEVTGPLGVPAGTGIRGIGSTRGVLGESRLADASLAAGIGVQGATGTGTGVRGDSTSGAGVRGNSGSGAGVEGMSTSGMGVEGVGSTIGVRGFSTTGEGVSGQGISGVVGVGATLGVQGQVMGTGVAVKGTTAGGDSTGVLAENTGGGVGLQVSGKAKFSTAGRGTISADASSATVLAPVDPATSVVLVTLLTDPGKRVHWVTLASGSFTLNLRTVSGPSTHPPVDFMYLVLN
jgi:hypothetical protein